MKYLESFGNYSGGARDHMRIQGLPVEGGIAGGYYERPKVVIMENEEDSSIELELYHGTNKDFDKFDIKKFNTGSGDGGWLGKGFYFTNSYEYANSHADSNEGIVVTAKVILKKPYILTDALYSSRPQKFNNELGVNNASEARVKLMKEGYDSVILKYPDEEEESGVFIEVCVFEPHNIEILSKEKSDYDESVENYYESNVNLTVESTHGEDIKEENFLQWFNRRMGTKITESDYIDGGAYGRVYSLDKWKVIKFTSEVDGDLNNLLNKNVEGVVKVYSTGIIKTPKKFIDIHHKGLGVMGGFMIGKVMLDKKDDSNDLSYIIMERVNTNGVANIIAKIGDEIEKALDLNTTPDYNSFPYIDFTYETIEKMKLYEGSDGFKYPNYFSNHADVYRYLVNYKGIKNQDGIKRLFEIFRNIKNAGYDWYDIHEYQFGRNKEGKLVAFDIDNDKDNIFKRGDREKEKQPKYKNVVRETKSISKTYESFTSQREIEKLATIIIDKVSEKTLIDANKDKEFYSKNGDQGIKRTHINSLASVYLQYDFTSEDIEKFTYLNRFISEYKLRVNLKFAKEDDDMYSDKGSFGSDTYYQSDNVLVYVPYENKVSLNNDFDNGKIDESDDIKYSIWSQDMFSTLIHELKHAYDTWASDGKIRKKSNKYLDDSRKSKDIKRGTNISSDDENFLDNQHKKYMNLPIEIYARFVQTAREVLAYKMNMDTRKREMLTFDEYFNKFTNSFEGWNGLTINFKKRLTKKIRRFYSEQKTEMDNLNEKRIKD